MALEAIQSPPVLEEFTLLSEHQEQTPGSFFGGRTVLHLHSPGTKIKISREDLESQADLASLRNGDVSLEDEEQVVIDDVDVWVSSSNVTLFSPTKSSGVQIPYPTITVHAQNGSAVLLGLNLSDSNTADEDLVFIQLRIIPTTIETHAPPAQEDVPQQPNGHAAQSPVQALFKAVSDCQELNPDPPEEGDEEVDETAPGTTGWVTRENMQDFVGENGEFRMPTGATVVGAEENESLAESGLGEGAGRRRSAAEVDGEDAEVDEAKWQRTG